MERSWAAASPAGPAPTIAICIPDGVYKSSLIRCPAVFMSAAALLRLQMPTGSPLPGHACRQTGSQGRVQIRPRTPGRTFAILLSFVRTAKPVLYNHSYVSGDVGSSRACSLTWYIFAHPANVPWVSGKTDRGDNHPAVGLGLGEIFVLVYVDLACFLVRHLQIYPVAGVLLIISANNTTIIRLLIYLNDIISIETG